MPTVFGAESHEDELKRQRAGRDLLTRSQAEGWQRIDTPTRPGAYYVRDQYGNIYGVKSYGGLEKVNPADDPNLFKASQKSQFDQDLAKFRTESERYRDDTTRSFRTQAEYNAARQSGAVAASAGLEGMRRNLGDEYTAALGAEAQTRLRSNVLDAELGFEQRMDLLQMQNYNEFVNGEFNFFRGLQAASYQAELAKDMARFEAQLQSDLNSQNLFGDMLELGFTVLGVSLFGPAAPAANYYGSSPFPSTAPTPLGR